jgi:hypothetical protein
VIAALLDSVGVGLLRAALACAGFTSAGVGSRRRELEGGAVDGAGDRLDTLIQVFLCGRAAPSRSVAAALAPLALDDAIECGLVEPYDDAHQMQAGIWLYPYHDWWVVSDLPRFCDLDQRRPTT